MVFQILIILLIIHIYSAPATADSAVAKPGCLDRCGNTTIPYPFGTTPECYQHYSFWVTCNDSDHSIPPRLFLQNSKIEIADISLDGQLRCLQFIAKNCYSRNGTRIWGNEPWIRIPNYLTVNNTANKFTIVGCDSYAYVSGRRLGREYTTGCTAMCNAVDELVVGSCNGVGCCQTPIPGNASTVEVEVKSFNNHTDVWNFDRCGYGFLVEETEFRFSPDNLTNLINVNRLPIVVDWAIGNGTCEEAEMNSTSYACLSPNSGCYKPGNGYGYRCRCEEGYHGNPYLINGCQDIDECGDSSRNDCYKNEYCKNIEGGYTCSCPEGYFGDGRGELGCTKMEDRKKDHMKIAYILIGVAFGITALLSAAILFYFQHKRRSSHKMRQQFFHQNGGTLLQEKLARRERSPDMVRIFGSSELEKATNDFHSSMIIGQGGFGVVYKGVLTDNTTIAIKKSKRIDSDQIEQFINEVFVLSQINHRNVVRLLGCCLETESPLLVYELINNGTLSSHIHENTKARFLLWEMRLRIAADTAGVLSYLHSAAATPIIHRDVKSDNILLDHTCTAKVSDFGASRLVPQDLTQLSTMVQGTFGYLDPEYLQTNQLTEKSDVYSFGVVLLELITGRKAISFDKTEEEKNLANYFLSILKQQRLYEIVDANIVQDDGNMKQILEVARVAKECLNVNGKKRPTMKQVAMELEGLTVGGKHSWIKNGENGEEMERLLGEAVIEVEVDVFGKYEGGNSTNVGFDSIRDHVVLPISGGR